MPRGYRMTRQRQIILDELRNVTSHPTADQVYEMVRLHLPHISLGTVYRNLESLCEQGMIQKLEMGGVQRRYDGNPGSHYHVRCQHCDRVDDVTMDPVFSSEDSPDELSGYRITGHRLEFMGVCPQCYKNRKPNQSTGRENNDDS